jgi:hypothetical protein
MSKKTLLQITTHHRQNPLDFMNPIIHNAKLENLLPYIKTQIHSLVQPIVEHTRETYFPTNIVDLIDGYVLTHTALYEFRFALHVKKGDIGLIWTRLKSNTKLSLQTSNTKFNQNPLNRFPDRMLSFPAHCTLHKTHKKGDFFLE